VALWRKCPHLGCQVPQVCDASQWFECLCHGSKYTILGEKRDGPAPRGMDQFAVNLVDGAYVVDTREVITGPPVTARNFDPRTPDDVQGRCA
jgi:cytochrome b6-f complex iron-sulfur subunit